MDKTTLFIRFALIGIILLVICTAALLAFNHIKSDKQQSSEESSTSSTIMEPVSEEEETLNKITVHTVGKHNFKNGENITFENIELSSIKKDSAPLYLVIHEDYMTDENKNLFNELAVNGHSILFYNEEINPEDVVMYFDAKIMVVNMQATVPLSFQAYGISTLEEEFIPLMIQTTTTSEIEVDALYNLFNQHQNLR